MKKIIFLISNLNLGGAEKTVYSLYKYYKRSNNVKIICFERNIRFSLNEDIISLNQKPLDKKDTSFFLLFRIINILKKIYLVRKIFIIYRPDVIVSMTPSVNLYSIFCSLFLKNKIIISERISKNFFNHSFIKKLVINFFYKYCDKLVVQTDEILQDYKDFNTTIIPNFVTKTKLRINYFKQRKNIISVGRLDNQKNFQFLIKAFANSLKANKDWRLLIFGEGENLKSLRLMIKNYKLEKNIFLKGVSQNIKKELVNASFYASTSLYEGFSNAMLEATSVGLPIIAFDGVSGNNKIVINGFNGIVVKSKKNINEYSQGLSNLMSQIDLQKKYSINSLKIAEKYSQEKIMKLWNNIIL